MKKAIKWFLITIGVIIAFVIVAVIVIPMFIDVQKYKPDIENKVSEITGRPFKVGGDLNLSLFPWVGLSFSDLHLGNPPGFQEKDILSVDFFEVRVKLIPLISRSIQVKRFVLEGPRIVLEKSRSGKSNWEGLGKTSGEVPPEPLKEEGKTPETKADEALPIKDLGVGEFSILKGSIILIDRMKDERKEISDMTLSLKDVSLDRPVQITFSAKLDGHPIELKGDAGPIGKTSGKGTMTIDLSVRALKELAMNIKGKIIDPASRREFDLEIQLSPFSPRKLVAALGKKLPMVTADSQVLNSLAFNANLKGNPQNVTISDGVLIIDDSTLNFTAGVKDFSWPDVAFDLNLDRIDIDRYFPPSDGKKSAEKKKSQKPSTTETKKIDYGPFRKLILDGKIRVKELKSHGANVQDLYMKITGRKGIFKLEPLTLKLYEGDVASKASFDVQKDIPGSKIELRAKGIQANPLLNDLLDKDFLEGTLKAELDIELKGDDVKTIKKTLNGKGDFLFNDGAIKGIDLAGMVRNVTAALGLAEKGGEKPRTDFSELSIPFTVTDGLVNTDKTSLTSPFLRVLMAGKADLVKESLNFRIEPKFVGTLKGQGDTKQRSGITVPVLVTGSFFSPRFRPDLKGLLQQELGKDLPEKSDLKKMLSGEKQKDGKVKPLEEELKGLLEGLSAPE